ncbi:uncharacterized protein LOC115957920 [Quercus lobata]|uniref:uncharacterized protein LOC115957920 n=1 Tax=Quercus lobata TaxID=97700 RepID=UPI001244A4C1|nr:uncharacterized protein LOC115957920 [Quercus lobata]
MEAYNIKGGIIIYYPLALFAILILNAYCCCGSPVIVESNTTNFLGNDVLGEFLTDDDSEFPVHSYISRMLAGSPNAPLNPRKPAPPCGQYNDGRYCVDSSRKIPRSVYDRSKGR